MGCMGCSGPVCKVVRAITYSWTETKGTVVSRHWRARGLCSYTATSSSMCSKQHTSSHGHKQVVCNLPDCLIFSVKADIRKYLGKLLAQLPSSNRGHEVGSPLGALEGLTLPCCPLPPCLYCLHAQSPFLLVCRYMQYMQYQSLLVKVEQDLQKASILCKGSLPEPPCNRGLY